MSDDPALPLSKQSFTASTPDESVFVRVAVLGHILGVQLEPTAMDQSGHELAERIMACHESRIFRVNSRCGPNGSARAWTPLR